MQNSRLLILGTGHLANRVTLLAQQQGFDAVHIANPGNDTTTENDSAFERITGVVGSIQPHTFDIIYLLDDKDERNLEYIIAVMSLGLQVPVAASLFNENLAPHLQAAYPNLKILNPARMAASAFAQALDEPVERTLRYKPVTRPKPKRHGTDWLISKLLAGFVTIIILATVYFHHSEQFSWLDAFYFVVVTVTSVGYGDISLLHASDLSKVLNIVLIISATVFIWMIFSLVIDRIIKKRIQLSMGRRTYPYKNHVLVCGLGRLGFCIAEELLAHGEKVVVVELNENSDKADQLRLRGVDVYIGNARSFAVLEDVNVAKAKALISVVDNDYLNLEIGLNARSLQPNLKLVLRVFDEIMAKQLKDDLEIHLTLSMSAVADGKFLELTRLISAATTAAT